MKEKSHDTLVFRLSDLLIKLNHGEKLNLKSLASEYGVGLRTLQRDLNIRLAYLPIVKKNNYYELDPFYLGKLNSKDISNFAKLAGVKGLFPSLNEVFLKEIFEKSLESAILVKGHNYENIAHLKEQFTLIETTVLANLMISFQYNNKGVVKNYINVCPYKLINQKGIWYVVADDNGKLKTFSFTKIAELKVLDGKFLPSKSIHDKINNMDNVWISNDSIKVTLEVSHKVSEFFIRRKIIPSQVIEKTLENGNLIITSEVTQDEQILPIVQYWMPNIKIISPIAFQENLKIQLEKYLADL